MSQQFLNAGRDQLFELYKLVTFRKIESLDLDYLIEWVENDTWAADPAEVIVWLGRMPQRANNSLDEIVAVEAMSERRNKRQG